MKFFLALIIIGIFTSVYIRTLAQDPHFTQYNYTPFLVNPAKLAMRTDMQLILNHRSQWGGIIKPYTTTMATGMYPFVKSDSTQQEQWGGIGLSVYNDQAGDIGKIQTLNISGGFAYNFNLGTDNYLSAGIQIGYIQKALTTDKLTSGNQWENGKHNPSKDLGETFDSKSVSMEDVGGGIMWYKTKDEDINYYFGISAFHLTQPKESFTSVKGKLPMRFAINGGLKAFSFGKIDVVPGLLYTNQASAQEINLGSYFKYNFKESAPAIFKGGYAALAAWYRFNDAVNVGVEFARKNYVIGFSYDVNTSALNNNFRNGAFEVTLVLKKPTFKKKKKEEITKEEATKDEIIVSLLVNVKDAETLKTLVGEITLVKTKSGDVVQSVNDSILKDTLTPGIAYQLTVKKEGYEPNVSDIKVSSKITASKEIKKKILMGKPAPPPPPAKPAKETKAPVVKKVEEKKEPKKEFNQDDNKILFEPNKSTLNKSSFAYLDNLVTYLKDNPKVKLEVQGHTNFADNVSLSNRRAQTVVDYLISKGIDKNRLSIKGLGGKQNIASNKTEEGRSKNRRVEFIFK